jgi:hypothetical protein
MVSACTCKEVLAALTGVSCFIQLNAEGKLCSCQLLPVTCFKTVEKISVFLEWMYLFQKGTASIFILCSKPQTSSTTSMMHVFSEGCLSYLNSFAW